MDADEADYYAAHPYPPDMDLAEAVRTGRAVIQTDEGFRRPLITDRACTSVHNLGLQCQRPVGHDGFCGAVVNWNSQKQQAELKARLEKEAAERRAIAEAQEHYQKQVAEHAAHRAKREAELKRLQKEAVETMLGPPPLDRLQKQEQWGVARKNQRYREKPTMKGRR